MEGLALHMHSGKQMTDSHMEYLNNLLNLYHKEAKDNVFKGNQGLELTLEVLNEIRVSINHLESLETSLRDLILIHDTYIEKVLSHVLVEVQEVHTITSKSHKKVKKIWKK